MTLKLDTVGRAADGGCLTLGAAISTLTLA
jgi:hypothetical protein